MLSRIISFSWISDYVMRLKIEVGVTAIAAVTYSRDILVFFHSNSSLYDFINISMKVRTWESTTMFGWNE